MRSLCKQIFVICSFVVGQLPLPAQKTEPQEKPLNRLAQETSPYLLQHSHNPVDWYPWGDEALDRAKKENKVIFLSIGYSACHWCHVMERESFENPKIAALMNEHFVCIKVDREERPDLDEIYMASVQAMTGRGGWPMSVWMTPELQPFYAGTYFPPEDSMGMPGFRHVLEHVQGLWTDRREEVESRSAEITAYLEKILAQTANKGDPELDSVTRFAEQSRAHYDSLHGGFGQSPQFAPKFPHATEISMLLRYAARAGDEQSLEAAEHTLDRMARGGMYDQLAGGFHRYSTDRQWLAPHFEKMLYDNSQLAQVYAEAYLLTKKPLYARILRETLDYMLREMLDEQGGFYSTQDADSEGEEGKFFVWSKDEVDRIVGEDAALIDACFDVSVGGNWQGHNILRRLNDDAGLAERFGLAPEVMLERIGVAKQKLMAVRQQRVAPSTDDKILTAWNGMAISALASGYRALGDRRYLKAAQRAAGFILSNLRKNGKLLRTWRDGRAHLAAYLEDYAFLADALLSLFESDFDPRWLREAKTLLATIKVEFYDPGDGNFFFTGKEQKSLIARSKTVSESSVPSGIAMTASAFLRAGLLTGEEQLYQLGFQCLRANNQYIESQPLACPSLMLAVDFALGDPRELVIAGEPNDPKVLEFLHSAWFRYPPHHVVTLVHAGNRRALLEIAAVVEGKQPIDGQAAAYLCRRGVCDAPVTEPSLLTWH